MFYLDVRTCTSYSCEPVIREHERASRIDTFERACVCKAVVVAVVARRKIHVVSVERRRLRARQPNMYANWMFS